MFIDAKLLIFRHLLRSRHFFILHYLKNFSLKKVKSNVRMPCFPEGYLIQTKTILVRKFNLGPDTPLRLGLAFETCDCSNWCGGSCWKGLILFMVSVLRQNHTDTIINALSMFQFAEESPILLAFINFFISIITQSHCVTSPINTCLPGCLIF